MRLKKLAFAALALLPLVGGCAAEVYAPRPYARVYVPRPPAVYVAPPPVYVPPPPVVVVRPPRPRVHIWW